MKIRNLLIGTGAGVAMFGLLAATAFAAANVSNGSFEDGSYDVEPFVTLYTGNPGITDWAIMSGSVDWITTYWQASDGTHSVDMSGSGPASIRQTIATVPGTKYRVTFDMSGNPDGGNSVKQLKVYADDGQPQVYEYDTAAKGNTHEDMMWEEETYEFTATGATTDLNFASGENSPYGPALDNVRISEVLPTNMNECKKSGWESFGVFKNQGDCVSFVTTAGRNLPAVQ